MGIIKDHNLRRILEQKNLRSDPEVLNLVCDVIESFDDDIDNLGGIEISRRTDNKLEKLAEAVTRVEDEDNEIEDEEIDEDEDFEEDELDDEDEEVEN